MTATHSLSAAEASSFNRDPTKVYPANPPRSPHLAWLNLLTPGLAQIVYGKTGLGIVGVIVTQVLSVMSRLPSGTIVFLCVVCYLGLLISSIVDAYKTGRALGYGKPVGKWQIFPS